MRSLGLLVVAFIALVASEGCGSDSNTGKKPDAGGLTAAGGGGGGSAVTGAGGGGIPCMASYCQPVNGAPACCVNNACGYNAGNGCVPSGLKPDAGAH
ncbi:MAG TPA: hypothetical protein VH062_11175 [Polyangiaceae bacterium]|nr:hypothetical protein [Polyangiaceae bacterium]